MKITRITPILAGGGHRIIVFVKVETDQPGLIGWGEATLESGWRTRSRSGRSPTETSRAASIGPSLAPHVRGEPLTRSIDLCEVAVAAEAVLESRGTCGAVFDQRFAAAEQALPKISAKFTRQYFEGQTPSADAIDRSELADSVDDIDDLLLGRR